MDLAPPPAGSAPVLDPPAGDQGDFPEPVIGGVAAMLAARLDVDAVWVRIGFVLLALVGGLGVVVYGAMWLALVVGAAPHRRWARLTGGVVLVAGLPLLLSSGFTFFDGPFAVLALLAGLAVALWQPRGAAARADVASAPPDILPHPVAPDEIDASSHRRTPRTRWTPRPSSILGRLTLGVAVLVAAIGALIDQANGGRLHPDQWLGAAAVACGIGLLVGAFAGRARWLILPALVFAGSGFVAGEAARIGLDPTNLFGDETLFVSGAEPGGGTRREHVAIGRVEINVDGAPRAPIAVDARVAVGEVEIDASEDVTVEVHAQVDHGTVEVDNVRRGDGTFTIGPGETPDLVVTAIVARGDLEIHQYEPRTIPEDMRPTIVVPRVPASPTMVGDGVAVTSAGHVVLADVEAVISTDGTVLTGDSAVRDGIVVVDTSAGEFRLLPGELLLTPSGEVLDLTNLSSD